MSPEEHFRKLERMYAPGPINVFFRPSLRVGHGEAEVRIPVRPEFHHSAGAVHGAVYFKALDDATFFAASSLVTDVFVLTARFEIEFLRPVVEGEVRAVARVVDASGRRIVVQGELHDAAGEVIGRGRGEFARSKTPLGPSVHYE